MVVVAIVGVLSAVALPQFLGVKDKAEAGASIGEQVGLAKECSTAIRIDGPYMAGCGTAGANAGDPYTAPGTNPVFQSAAAPLGTKCGPTVTTNADKACIVTVNKDSGEITYSAET